MSCLEGLHPVFISLLFPAKEPLATAQEARAVDTKTGGEGSKKGAPKKRRRDSSGDGGDDDGKETDETGDKKSKKRGKKKRTGSGGAATDMEAVTGAEAGDDGKAGQQKEKKGVAGLEGGVPRGGRGGEKSVRAALPALMVLTKEDFRTAALLPAWKPMQPALYSFFK